ncbi:MAG: Trp biosynthesis-associated membrane protein, partial [Actinomycetota bacterium]
WRSGRWPVMSARYDAPGQARATAPARRADTATIWESLSRGEDPTDGRDPADADGPAACQPS